MVLDLDSLRPSMKMMKRPRATRNRPQTRPVEDLVVEDGVVVVVDRPQTKPVEDLAMEDGVVVGYTPQTRPVEVLGVEDGVVEG